MPKKLSREFYLRDDTLQIARELLGKTLVVPDESGRRVSGRIVETEAYKGIHDRAAHSYKGRRTPRTEVMFGRGGTAYIFLVYGIYFQFNVVVGRVEVPHVVLIRAVEPLEGLEKLRERRGKMNDTNLTSGPGKLCIALGIDKSFYGEDLLGERIWIEEAATLRPKMLMTGKRIGIDYAGQDAERHWRFWMKDNPYVSRT